jgi:hypothetical protein
MISIKSISILDNRILVSDERNTPQEESERFARPTLVDWGDGMAIHGADRLNRNDAFSLIGDAA